MNLDSTFQMQAEFVQSPRTKHKQMFTTASKPAKLGSIFPITSDYMYDMLGMLNLYSSQSIKSKIIATAPLFLTHILMCV